MTMTCSQLFDNVHIVFDEEERVAVLAQLVDPIEELLL